MNARVGTGEAERHTFGDDRKYDGVTALRFGPDDALRCRFAVSPLWETHAAVRLLHGYHRPPLYAPWLARRGRADDAVDHGLLRAVQPHTGYTPDFLSPPPRAAGTTFAAELQRVRDTPLERVAAELARCRDQSSNPLAATLDPLVDDPAVGRARLVAELQAAWSSLLEPDWPQVRRILDDDVAYRGTCLTNGGLAGLFDDLHPNLAWRNNELIATEATDQGRDLAGEGLLLVPSAFNWPHLSVIVDLAYQPTLVYPARGTARLWTSAPLPPDRLARLLGRTRATVLAALDEPATTTGLAAAHTLSLGTVSEHLHALHDAGLASKRRAGHQIRYWRTPLGQALVDAAVE
jgi:DNA-binding transcriptional ArsR family regulator